MEVLRNAKINKTKELSEFTNFMSHTHRPIGSTQRTRRIRTISLDPFNSLNAWAIRSALTARVNTNRLVEIRSVWWTTRKLDPMAQFVRLWLTGCQYVTGYFAHLRNSSASPLSYAKLLTLPEFIGENSEKKKKILEKTASKRSGPQRSRKLPNNS